jgi:DMSO reductase family type II enzyme heme b subunit
MEITMRKMMMLAVLVTTAGMMAACGRSAPPEVAEVVAGRVATVPSDPADPVWRTAPVHVAALLLQDMVEPRLLKPSTPDVRVQAATDGREIAFRLEWVDGTEDDLPLPGQFSDGCAVQLPARAAPGAPAPQMGETGREVEITYWRASWQAVVNGRGDTIRDLYPHAAVDHYPFEAASMAEGGADRKAMEARYAPARTLGNTMAGPRDRPVEDLIAMGPGSLMPAKETRSNGHGVRTKDGWAVVLRRPAPSELVEGRRSPVAFAVWEGAQEETGARKMRTGWIQMSLEVQP